MNSGFIYGLRLAFPKDKIRLYAAASHIEAVKNILLHDQVFISNIEYIPIKFSDTGSLKAFLQYIILFNKLFNQVVKLKVNKIFFLSFSPPILFVIKKLKKRQKFSALKFSFVLHGDFENINTKTYQMEEDTTIDPVPPDSMPIDVRSFSSRVRSLTFSKVVKKICFVTERYYENTVNYCNSKITGLFEISGLFETREALLLNHTNDYRYIALAPYIVANASKFIDVEKLNIHTVLLPTFFIAPKEQLNNEYPKFAIFGFGNPKILRKIALKLIDMQLTQKYEIRVIGMATSGLQDLPNIFCVSPGKRLPRVEMEKWADDIDIFLNLYTKNQYQLSCSNSILEALSYIKPVFHFDNDCVNFFNHNNKPIGICNSNIVQYVEYMADVIQNYSNYQNVFKKFRENILLLREEYAIKNSVDDIRNAFSWQE
ncbi:MAG: hypothetical protein H7339_08240 [Arcicella sp.]|nr:hypothetical protein [Arcicella sp.]